MAFFIIFTTNGCYQPAIPKPLLSLKPDVGCRVIQQELGKTCVPLKPQRIVALAPEATVAPLVALGIKPIGYTTYYIPNRDKQSLFGISFDDVKGARSVGDVYQPSLEKILMLKPDLILGVKASQYKLLSAIAPTVIIPTHLYTQNNQVFFKENLRFVAKVLGQETKAKEVLSQYQERIDELKQRLGNQLDKKEVAVIFYGEGVIWTIINNNRELISAIFNDIGLNYKFLPISKDTNFMDDVKLSIEAIGDYDADVLFIVDVGEKGANFYFQNPLFRSLKAIKNNRAYVVAQESWYTDGILGANNVLDDLFKYLPHK
jgi:iron complex transport system substrate-binding protein